MEFHSAMERNKLGVHITTAVGHKSIVPSDRSWAQKATYLINPFTRHSRIGRTMGKEIRRVLPGAVGRRRGLMTQKNGHLGR